jgi:hypothetical protein
MQKYFVCSEGYWYRSAPRQRWKRLQQGMVVSQLKTAGLSGDREKGSKSCEIDRFVASMVEMRFADDQAPFFFDSRECVTQGDRTILNLWSRPPFWFDTQPDSGVVPERDFPFLWSIINMWDDVPFDGIHPANWLIEWLRREVLQMLAMKGLGFTHAIVLSGPVGSGKTLFLNAVLGALYGVSQIPGAEEYLKGSNFNAKLMQSPVWGLDDGVPALKNETRVNIQARLKKLVASTTVTFEAKGVDAIDVDMHPRILLCCNSERMASTVVPTIDPSTEDKFVFLKVDPKKKVQFYPTKHENKARIEHEIPYLVAWLLAREPDPTVVRNNRCGMGVYRHPEVEAASRSNVEGGVSDEEISERVWIYMEGFGDSQDKKNHPGDFNPTKRRRSVFATELRSFLEQRDMSVELRLPGSMLKHSLTVSNTLCEKAKQYTQRMQEDPDFVPPITITRQGNRDRLHFYLDSPYFRTHNKHLPDDNRPF